MVKAEDIAAVYDNAEMSYMWSLYLCITSGIGFLICGVVVLVAGCNQGDLRTQQGEQRQEEGNGTMLANIDGSA